MSFFVVINFRALDTGLTENPGPTAEPTHKLMRHDSAVRPVTLFMGFDETPCRKTRPTTLLVAGLLPPIKINVVSKYFPFQVAGRGPKTSSGE